MSLLAAELHLAALRLPDLPGEDAAPEPPNVDRARISRLRLTTWPATFYWDVFEPLNTAPDPPVGNSIDDDLSDIYSDLRGPLLLYESGHASTACWHWRFTFEVHWGEHLVGLQRALYWMAREHLAR